MLGLGPAIAAASGVSWTGIMLAVLGSSALGAVVGGVLTTRMRGGIERDEAWRGRLIDAADGFLSQLTVTKTAISHDWLVAIESGKAHIRMNDGKRTGLAVKATDAFDEERAKLIPLKDRFVLLFGPDASGDAEEAVRILINAGAVLNCESWVPATLGDEGGLIAFGVLPEIALGSPTGRDTAADFEDDPPDEFEDEDEDDFDLDDDSAVAELTRQLLESVPRYQQALVHICRERIWSEHPGRPLGAGRVQRFLTALRFGR